MERLPDRTPDIRYPCTWTYQIVGSSAERLRACVVHAVGGHEHELEESRRSRTGRYVSFRLRLLVRDEAHRLEVLARLRAEETVRYVL